MKSFPLRTYTDAMMERDRRLMEAHKQFHSDVSAANDDYIRRVKAAYTIYEESQPKWDICAVCEAVVQPGLVSSKGPSYCGVHLPRAEPPVEHSIEQAEAAADRQLAQAEALLEGER